MSTQSEQHTSQSSVGSNVTPLLDRKRPIQIRSSRTLFTWIWKQLEASEPKVAVGQYVPECVQEFYRTIRGGHPFGMYPPLDSSVIFAEIRWTNIHDPDEYQCAVPLLQFIGKLSEVLVREWGGKVPRVRACEMMLEFWDLNGAYIRYHEEGRHTFLISTRACELKYGVEAKVKMDDVPLDELFWTLGGEAPWPFN